MMRKMKAKASKTGAPSKPAAGADKPAADKPAADKPAADKPAGEKSAGEKPASEKPVAEKKGGHKPPADKHATDKHAAEKSACDVDKPAAGAAGGDASPEDPLASALEPAEARRPAAKRSRKSKYNLHVDCVLEGHKRRKFNFESGEVLRDFAQVLSTEDQPLIQTPRTFFRSLCDLFQQEFPNMLTQEVISAAVSTFDSS